MRKFLHKKPSYDITVQAFDVTKAILEHDLMCYPKPARVIKHFAKRKDAETFYRDTKEAVSKPMSELLGNIQESDCFGFGLLAKIALVKKKTGKSKSIKHCYTRRDLWSHYSPKREVELGYDID